MLYCKLLFYIPFNVSAKMIYQFRTNNPTIRQIVIQVQLFETVLLKKSVSSFSKYLFWQKMNPNQNPQQPANYKSPAEDKPTTAQDKQATLQKSATNSQPTKNPQTQNPKRRPVKQIIIAPVSKPQPPPVPEEESQPYPTKEKSSKSPNDSNPEPESFRTEGEKLEVIIKNFESALTRPYMRIKAFDPPELTLPPELGASNNDTPQSPPQLPDLDVESTSSEEESEVRSILGLPMDDYYKYMEGDELEFRTLINQDFSKQKIDTKLEERVLDEQEEHEYAQRELLQYDNRIVFYVE